MPQYIAVYDLKRTNPAPHSTFLDEAVKAGWKLRIWGPTTKKWFRLPNTTLVGEFKTGEAAKNAFDAAVAATSKAIGIDVDVEKHLIGVFDERSWGSDDRTTNP